MYQASTFRMSYDTPVVDITTPAQRRLALAYLKRWAQQDAERRMLVQMTLDEYSRYCMDSDC